MSSVRDSSGARSAFWSDRKGADEWSAVSAEPRIARPARSAGNAHRCWSYLNTPKEGETMSTPTEQTNNIVFYQTEDTNVVVKVVYKDETFWLTQKAMAALFDVNPQAITKHFANIYDERELEKNATCSKMEQIQKEGNRTVKRSLEFYNLDTIIAVGLPREQQKSHEVLSVGDENAARIHYERLCFERNAPQKRQTVRERLF